MRHLLCLALLAAATLLGSCSKSSSPSEPGPSAMFWLDSGNLAIESFSNAHPAIGELVSIARVVSGTSTRLAATAAAAVLDAVGNRLFVANGTEILVFDNASAANGNVVPSRVIQKQGGGFVNVTSLFLDAAGDQLYVGDRAGGGTVSTIYVIGNASTANNAVAPLRSITDTSTGDRKFVFVDTANNLLYVTDNCQVSVFIGASTLDGANLVPSRAFASCPTLDNGDHPLWLDVTRNELYVMNPSSSDSGVMVFASTASTPNVLPIRTIHGFPLDPAASLRNILLDTNHNRLYVASTFALFILDNASTLDGTLVSGVFPSQQLFGIIGLDMAAVAINTTP